ncbi:MAG: PorT family protein [Tannerella sp.]|nr:PorT family protein [Tannerella sp.]
MKKSAYILLFILFAFPSFSQKRKVQNQPYADYKLYHFGFHVGLHSQDVILTNNGVATPDGKTWFAEIPSYSPGFSVGVIGDLFLNPYMNLRLSPTIHFGDKTVYFKELTGSEEDVQAGIRSNYLSVPLDLKISSMRLNNYRPYITGGVYGAIDLGRRKGNPLLLKQIDYGFEFGFGCNIYMPFFKLAPEIKFKFGLPDLLEKNRGDLSNEEDKIFTNALSKATSRMIVLTFNFE